MPQTLTDILRQHNVPFRQHGEDHHVTAGWIGTTCPWCGGSGHHFGFHLGSGAASCWKCGPHNRTDAVARLCKIRYGIAVKLLGDERRIASGRPERLTTAFQKPKGVGPLETVHLQYLYNRGLPSAIDLVRLWGIQGIGLSGGALAWRIYIPIRNQVGQTVSWTTRAIGSTSSLRYISASADEESEPHHSLLYGAELARGAVVVVEGPTDAWAIGPGAVATCGVGFSREQIALISSYPVRAVCFDRDAAGQRRAEKLCVALEAFPGQTSGLKLHSGNDPAEADPAEIAEIRSLFLG